VSIRNSVDGAASRTNPEDLEVMSNNGVVRGNREIAHELVHRAGGERHGRPAGGADEVVAMPGRASDICGTAIGGENARQHIDRRQQLQGAVNRGSTDFGSLSDDLLGGKGPVVLQDGVNHGPARLGQAVAMIGKELADPGGGGRSGCSVFDGHFDPIAWWRVEPGGADRQTMTGVKTPFPVICRVSQYRLVVRRLRQS